MVPTILLSALPNNPAIVYSWTGGAAAGLANGNSTGLNPNIPSFQASANEGTTTVTLTATLGACTDVVMFDIIIDDADGLHWVNCPANIMVGNDVDECGAYVNWTPPTAIDDCVEPNDVIVTQTMGLPLTAGSFFPISGSPYTIEYTAEDGNGNEITCEFTVTIVDSQNPNAVCQDFSVYLDENGVATITAAQVDGGSYDNCDDDLEISIDLSAFDCDNVGENFVTLTVTDDDDNFDICVATVTVVDDIAPTIECPEDIVEVNDPGVCGAEVEFDLPVIDDNCDLPTGAGSATYNYSGMIETWVVPAGVTSITVQANGAQGGNGGGLGASMTGDFAVTPARSLKFWLAVRAVRYLEQATPAAAAADHISFPLEPLC
ncbi:MAG: HYR domain-containing protein [Saprospirales bacterium]|nr:HYR domain-containing protein [Saprospirales bacterium]